MDTTLPHKQWLILAPRCTGDVFEIHGLLITQRKMPNKYAIFIGSFCLHSIRTSFLRILRRANSQAVSEVRSRSTINHQPQPMPPQKISTSSSQIVNQHDHGSSPPLRHRRGQAAREMSRGPSFHFGLFGRAVEWIDCISQEGEYFD
jgi:hypothetical protein